MKASKPADSVTSKKRASPRPKDAGSPLHVHHRENEWFYVPEGELTIWADGQVIRAPAGSFVFDPPDTPTFTVSSEGAG